LTQTEALPSHVDLKCAPSG